MSSITFGDVVERLDRYSRSVNGHQFTRGDFLEWGAHRGLSRDTPIEMVQAAIDEGIEKGWLSLVQTAPGALKPAYRRAA